MIERSKKLLRVYMQPFKDVEAKMFSKEKKKSMVDGASTVIYHQFRIWV